MDKTDPDDATRAGYASIRDAARYLTLGERTVRRMIQEGAIPAYRLGGRVLVAYGDLDRVVRDHAIERGLPDSEAIAGLRP